MVRTVGDEVIEELKKLNLVDKQFKRAELLALKEEYQEKLKTLKV
jgi:hypothetical protein